MEWCCGSATTKPPKLDAFRSNVRMLCKKSVQCLETKGDGVVLWISYY